MIVVEGARVRVSGGQYLVLIRQLPHSRIGKGTTSCADVRGLGRVGASDDNFYFIFTFW